jgi:hypothetical protein
MRKIVEKVGIISQISNEIIPKWDSDFLDLVEEADLTFDGNLT